ncbi:MAG: hypothetical protein KDN18_17710 [Verrucomicrobiae bacterium]|nr:hypothetical protein [Verrucomicrobiae bacterium]
MKAGFAGVILSFFLTTGILFAVDPVFDPVSCEGDYAHHLQGVCTDRKGAIYWSFTTELVKTGSDGKVLVRIPVENHHGDLCFDGGKVYVAVNLGRFNDPEGRADSWIYVYRADTLAFLEKHPVPEVFHGAGGMDLREGHFFVVGGLPEGVEENCVYEYDGGFRLVKRHEIASGWTKMGIQTAAWHDGAWWFGCYGSPQVLLKTDEAFQLLGRYEFDASLGILGDGPGRFLVAKGPRTPEGRHRGLLEIARPDANRGLVRTGE